MPAVQKSDYFPRRVIPLLVGFGLSIITAIPAVHWIFYAKLQSSRIALKALYPLPISVALAVDMNGFEWMFFALVLCQFFVYGAIISSGRTRERRVRRSLLLLAVHLAVGAGLICHEMFLRDA